MSRNNRPRKYNSDTTDVVSWVPKTTLGKLVKEGNIASMSEALSSGYPLIEPEIVDILLPDCNDEVIDVSMVQRMTDSGRRVRFAVTTVVGNSNGFVGIGKSKGKEVGPTIRASIDNAKINMIEVRRGCGSWECGCGTPHSIPFEVKGKCGSPVVKLKPAPKGVGLAVSDIAKPILKLAGIKDAWVFTRGQTQSTVNYAKAIFDALKQTTVMRTSGELKHDLNIVTGAVEEEKEEIDEGV